jgi:hypothetical protein
MYNPSIKYLQKIISMERELLSVLVFHYSRVKMNKIEELSFGF